jgi:cytochrome bd ubiquinol oxidase subunit II
MLFVLPLVFVLAGLVLYAVLGGADFGAGFWQLFSGPGEHGERIREHAHHSMAPVWEANHVWLIFVLTVFWTGYPVAFGSIASTLAVPLFLAGLGIIFRGAAYALRAGTSSRRELRMVDTLFSISSLLVPFALGAMIGAIAANRVPVGNAAGAMFSSWLNPTAILIGVLAVGNTAYLAAVYLAADAARGGEAELERDFRARSLGAGIVTGAIAVGGLFVLHADDHVLFHELTRGTPLAVLIVSVLAGIVTLGLVYQRQFEAARVSSAVAVAAVIAAWAIARYPVLLPGLTVRQAAAPHDTLVTLVVAVLAGGVILFPSLALLFRLALTGRFDPGPGPSAAPTADVAPGPAAGPGADEGAARAAVRGPKAVPGSGRGRESVRLRPVPVAPPSLARVAVACLIAGIGFLNVADAGWAHALGVLSLFGFMITAFLTIVPAALAGDSSRS